MLEERHPGISHLCVSELFCNLRELFGFGFNMYKNFLALSLFKSDWWGVWREKGTFWFSSLQRSPPCPSLAFREVQDRNWQPAVFAQKAVSTQALALSRARSWTQGIWSQASLGARHPWEPGSPASTCAFCRAGVGCIPSWHGVLETWLTSGIDEHPISCAGLLALTTWNLVTFKLLQFLHAFCSFFDFYICVGLCL